MNRRERLLATMRGKTVDRPAVSFYELNGYDEDPASDDPFNVYTDPSWHRLIDLTAERTDRIVMRNLKTFVSHNDPFAQYTQTHTTMKDSCRFCTTRVRANGRTLQSTTKTEPDVNTVWHIEHLLKDVDDLKAFLDLMPATFNGKVDATVIERVEMDLGDSGIVMLDTPDALCLAAGLFDMETYTIIGLTEPVLFQELLSRFADFLSARTRAVAQALPGRLWRIYGPEYAAEPYLPPRLFRDYVVRHDTPMIADIQANGGWARIHSHGRLGAILDDIAATGCSGLDPIEPYPHGDMELQYVREHYGAQMVLFGNLELADIVNLPTPLFEQKVHTALEQGTAGDGRGFVLMPSAAPYGRALPEQALRNYEKMIEIIESL